MKLDYYQFVGARPGVAAHLLPVQVAQSAHNCKFKQGDLRSFAMPSQEGVLALSNVQSIFEYTENSTTHWVESANDVDAVKSPLPNDSYERMFFTGETEPRFFANDNISSPFDPDTDYYKLGIPAPATAPTLSGYTTGSDYRAYFYIYVNSYDDTGPNSDVTEISDYGSGRVQVSTIATAPASRAITHVWVYRTNSSGAGTAEYQKVCEAKFFSESDNYSQGDFVVYSNALYECTAAGGHSGAWNPANFTAGEAVANADLGAVCASTTYQPPPSGLKGLIALANGTCAGFYGNMLYMTEPNKPWAWVYTKSFEYDIVGIFGSGTNIFVLTQGRPYRVYGQHPSAMAVYDYPDILPCEVKRSVVGKEGIVYYRARHGLARVDMTRAMVVTDKIEDQSIIIESKSWQNDYAPSLGVFYDGMYFGFSASAGFYIDLATRTCCTLSAVALAAHVSRNDGRLYMAMDQGGANYVMEWEGDSQNFYQYTWRGRVEQLAYGANLAYALVILDNDFLELIEDWVDLETVNETIFASGINGALQKNTLQGVTLQGDDLVRMYGYNISGDVSIKVYASDELKCSRTVDQVEQLKSLADGYLARRFWVELSGYVPLKRIVLAPSPEEVMGVG